MKVKCQECGMAYDLDETMVTSAGTSVRCSSCSKVFKVYPQDGLAAGQDEWTVTRMGGEKVSFKRMGILQQWIAQEKLSPNDVISRNNGPSKRIADIPEMARFFPEKPLAAPVEKETQKPKGAQTLGAMQAERNVDTLPPPPIERKVHDTMPLSKSAELANTVAAMAPPVKKASPRIVVGDTDRPETYDKATVPLAQVPVKNTAAFAPTAPPIADRPMAPPSTGGPTSATMPMELAATQQAAATPKSSVTPPPPEPAPVTLDTPHSEPDRAPAPSDEPDLSQIPAAEDEESWDEGAEIPVDGKSWEDRSGSIGAYDEELDLAPPPKKVGRWISLAVVIILVAVGAYFAKFERDRLGNMFDKLISSSADDRLTKFFDRGMESFLMDSDTHYRQADREFQKVLALDEKHAPTLAALAEMYAVWAQYTRDTKLDAETDSGAQDDSESNKREIDRLQKEFDERVSESLRWANQAIEVDSESESSNRAMADVKRLQGNMADARVYLAKAGGEASGPETKYVSVLIEMDSGASPDDLVARIDGVLKDRSLIRAMYRKARLLAGTGEAAPSKAALNKLFELNSDHLRGRDLMARLDDKKAVAITTGSKAVSPSDTAATEPEDTAQQEPEMPAAEDEPDATEEPAVAETPSRISGSPATSGSGGHGGGGGGGGGDVDSMILQAAKLQENGRSGEALTIFERVLERSPSNVEALSGMAYCYLDKGNTGKAVASFRRALGVNSSFGPALIGLAQTYKSLGQNEQALKYYKKYLVVKPNGGQAGIAKRNVAMLEETVGSGSPPPDAPPPSTGDTAPPPSGETSPKPPEGGDENIQISPSGGDEATPPSSPSPPPTAPESTPPPSAPSDGDTPANPG